MKKHITTLVRLVACAPLLFTALVHPKAIFTGAIQFPQTVQSVPAMRIYYNGYRIETSANQKSKKVIFDIPEEASCTQLYVLITDKIDFETSEHNTIQYLKRCPGVACKMFSLTATQSPTDATKKIWQSTAMDLENEPLRIPENSIIVYYNPEYIDTLVEGAHHVALPTIMIKTNILDTASESKLHEASTMALLSSLEANTVHGPVKTVTTNHRLKNIVMITS